MREITRKCKQAHKSFHDTVAEHRWQLITLDSASNSDEYILDNLVKCFKWRVVLFRDLDGKVDVDAIA